MEQRSLRRPHAGGRPYIQEGTEGTKKKEASDSREPLTTERLCDIWEKIRSDDQGRRALGRLDEAGFRISHLKPTDATFGHPSWADYIAALPLVPNKPSTRYIHTKTKLQKYWPLVRELRQFAARLSILTDVRIFGGRDYPDFHKSTLRDDLLKTAEMLDHFLSWDYYVCNPNLRNALIAELRYTIRERTGKPHDSELNVLIDAAFRAAGYKEGSYIESNTLDRIEKRQKESRIKANKRIRSLMSMSSPSRRRSTRIRRKSRKRV
jgi:hypothetical protein